MSEMMEVRYYIAEKNEVPIRYWLIGGLSFYPNPFENEFDLRTETTEYDEGTGLIYRFRVPGSCHFSRKEERKDLFYCYVPRDLSVPGLAITIERVDDQLAAIRKRSTKSVWIEDIMYNLRKERVESVGKGLLSLDIPIALPKTLERIIGKGEETNLTVQGSEKIAISGTSNWCSNCPYTEGTPRQDKFPDLNMDQQLNVSLHGNIGEKINVEIQHSSTSTGIQSTNRVRINYRGFDDDVIKLIEMGDTDLSLSGAQLVTYSGGAKGLFGVKAIAQTGPLDVTVIASKQEGENASGTFSAQGGQINTVEIPDYDFIQKQFFYFENPGFDYPKIRRGFGSVYPVIGGDDDIEVFISLTDIERNNPQNIVSYPINAYPDEYNNGLPDDIDTLKLAPVTILCKQLFRQNGDYTLLQNYGAQGETRYVGIELARPLEPAQVLAVRYKAHGPTGDFLVGNYKQFPIRQQFPVQYDTLQAELICSGVNSADSLVNPTWPMMLRNVYSLGQSQIDKKTLVVRIEDTSNRAVKYIQPESGLNYLRIFGLDNVNNSTGAPGKDDIIDDLPGIIDPDRGYLMFPSFEPFNPSESDVKAYLNDKTDARERDFNYRTLLRDSAFYNSELEEKVKTDNHHYYIVVESSSGQRTFQLAAFEIIEGSEVVTVDGVKLQRGTDYDIDYTIGTVTLKGPGLAQITPTSKVNIDYQQKSVTGGGKTSLLGIGTNLNLSPNSRISGTFLYSSVGAPKYSPRLGEEPSRNMAADVNGAFLFYPSWMTTLANLLPYVDTNNQSTLNLSGEVAMSLPNPNVKGEALIEDMEGVEETDVISLQRASFYESSPIMENGIRRYASEGLEFHWYNVPSERDLSKNPLAEYITSRRDLNPSLSKSENSNVNSLIINAINPGAGQWCGVMTGFPVPGLDLTTAQYLEIWVNDFQADRALRGGTVHIDFGRINENFYKPDDYKLDDEDKYPLGWTIDEDKGFDKDDDCKYTDGTDWVPSQGRYRGINCRKGNQVHDTEDLNNNGSLDTTNAYYSLSFNLRETPAIDIRSDFPDSAWGSRYYDESIYNRRKAWRKYRIELSKATTMGTRPSPNSIQHMRIWIEDPDSLIAQNGAQEPHRDAHMLQIAEVQFVGNRWQSNGIRRLDNTLLPPDSIAFVGQKLTIGTINNKDDPIHYRPPYRIQQEEGIENKEQSLTLKFEHFASRTSFSILKQFPGQGQNYQQYRALQFFIYPKDNCDSLDFYFQIAYDSTNYYEIEVPLSSRPAGRWIYANVNFSDLTNLKLAKDATKGVVIEKPIRDTVDPTRTYTARLRGNPTLFNVRYLFAGLRNRSGSTIDQGELWFNDIRLGDVRRDIDVAERVNLTADFANILQIIGGWQRTGPEFRSLQQSRGSGVTNQSYNLSAKTGIDRFVPTARFDLPISVAYTASSSLPKYQPQSDVEIADPAVRDRLKSVSSNFGFNVSMGRHGSTNFIMKNLFDNLRLAYSYAKREAVTPATRDTSWSMSGTLNYQIQFRNTRRLELFKGIKWRYWLSNLSYASSASREVRRSYTFMDSALVARPYFYSGAWSNAYSTLYEPFESIKIDFKMNDQRDLATGREIFNVPIGTQMSFNHSVGLNYQPSRQIFILSEFNPRFEFLSHYTEDLRPTLRQTRRVEHDTVRVSPDSVEVRTIPILDPVGTRNVIGQRNMNFTFSLDVGKYILRLGQITHLVEEGEISPRKAAVAGSYRPAQRSKEEIKKMLEDRMRPKTGRTTPRPEGAVADQDTIPSPPGGQRQPQPPPEAQSPEQAQAARLEELAARRPPPGQGRPEPGKAQGLPARSDTTAAAKADTTAARADTTAAKRQAAILPIKKLIKLLSMIEPVDANVRMSHRSDYQRLYKRASLRYQLGLSDGAGVPGKTSNEENSPETSSDDFGVDGRSKIGLTENVVMDFNGSYDQTKGETHGRTTQTTQIVWPALNLDWRGIEKFRLLRGYIKSSDLKIGFERRQSIAESGKSNEYRLAPLMTLDWKNALSTTVGVTYVKSTTVTNSQEVWNKSWSVNLDLRYNVEGSKGFGIPLPILNRKKISFKSTLTTNLGVSYASLSTYNQPASGVLSVSPNVSYHFSNNVTGALAINYRRTSGGALGQVKHQVQVEMSAEFKF